MENNERAIYLKKLRVHAFRIRSLRLLLLLLLLLLWECASRLGWIDSFIFSSPSALLATVRKLGADGSLFIHIGITLAETLVSFLLSTAAGILIAVLLWWFTSLHEVLEPYLIALNSLPKSALAPILIVWFGNTARTIIITSVSLTLIVTVLSVLSGFTGVSGQKLRLVRSLGGGKLCMLTKILLPASVPAVLNVLRVNIGLCLIGVIIGEFLSARAGLGYLIIYGSQIFRMDWVILSIVLLMLISVLFYQGLLVLEKRITKRFR